MEIKLNPGHFSGADSILLSVERAESSYGIPVAVLVGGPHSGQAFGPADVIPAVAGHPLGWLEEPARTTVAAARRAAGAKPDDLYYKFCDF